MKQSTLRNAVVALSAALASPCFAQDSRSVTLYGSFPSIGLIEAEMSNGARELRFRELVLTEPQVAQLMNPDFLRQLTGELTSNDARRVEVQVQTVDGHPFDLIIDKSGEKIKGRIDGARFASARDGKRLLKHIRSMFAAVEIRGTDGDDHALRLTAHKRGVDDAEPLPEMSPDPVPASAASIDDPSQRGEPPDRPEVEVREQANEGPQGPSAMPAPDSPAPQINANAPLRDAPHGPPAPPERPPKRDK